MDFMEDARGAIDPDRDRRCHRQHRDDQRGFGADTVLILLRVLARIIVKGPHRPRKGETGAGGQTDQ